jgi:hypothetical protein
MNGATWCASYFVAARLAAMGFYASNRHHLDSFAGHAIAFTLFKGSWAFRCPTSHVFNPGFAGCRTSGEIHSAHGNIARYGLIGCATRGRCGTRHTAPGVVSSISVTTISIATVSIATVSWIAIAWIAKVPIPVWVAIPAIWHHVGIEAIWIHSKRHHVGTIEPVIVGGIELKSWTIPTTVLWAVREVRTRIGPVKSVEGIVVTVVVAIVVAVVSEVGVPLASR